MSEAVPVYLVGSPNGRLGSVATALGEAAEVIASDTDVPSLSDRTPGVAVFDADETDARSLVAVLSTLPADQWTVAVVEDGDPPCLRTVSLGARDGMDVVLRHTADPESEPGCLLGLERALMDMARVRHDLNNPLTAAMAEAQLLLMDAPEGGNRESLEAILQQLRRMRDMLTSSRYLRPRKD